MSMEARTHNAKPSASHPGANGAGSAYTTGRISVVDGTTFYEPEFTPRAKHPAFDIKIGLVTEAAFRVFQSTYDPAQKALYHLFCSLPIMLRDEQRMVVEVHGVIEKRFTELETALTDELERLRHLAKTDGADQATRYFNQEPLVVVVLTPEMSRYLGLINSMDQVVRMVDALWFGMRIKQTERNQKMMEWRNRITKFHRELHTLHMRLLGAIQRRGSGAAVGTDDADDPAVEQASAAAGAKPNGAGAKPKPKPKPRPKTAAKKGAAKAKPKPKAAPKQDAPVDQVQDAADAPSSSPATPAEATPEAKPDAIAPAPVSQDVPDAVTA